jgi:membrane protease YdiL (CAAX protease family)
MQRRLDSIGLSRQKLRGNAFFGIFLSFFESLASVGILYALLVLLNARAVAFTTNPENLDIASMALMLTTFLLVVGPTEEIQSRGYFQTRLLEHFGPKLSIILPSVLFAAAHIPIDVLIWRYETETMLFHLLGVFTAGSIMGYLYYQSGVLTGPILMHAFSDTLSLTYMLNFDAPALGPGVAFGIMGLTYAVVTTVVFLFIHFLTAKLDLRAEKPPWHSPRE